MPPALNLIDRSTFHHYIVPSRGQRAIDVGLSKALTQYLREGGMSEDEIFGFVYGDDAEGLEWITQMADTIARQRPPAFAGDGEKYLIMTEEAADLLEDGLTLPIALVLWAYDKERSDTGVLAVLLHQSELKSYIQAAQMPDEQAITHAPILH